MVLNIILDNLLRWFAPILSFTTEEIYRMLFKNEKSIHLEKFVELPSSFENNSLNEKWNELIKIRNICNVSIEEKRASKEIGSSLEAEINIELDNKLESISKNIDFSELCITSKASVSYKKNTNTNVKTLKAKGTKCEMCWKIKEDKCDRNNCPKNN